MPSCRKDFEPVQVLLAKWYHHHKRELPWRNTQDAYRIWVSEIMLQQTRVETVIPFYHRFIQQYPDMQSLARAETQEVLRYWAGLGYYNRVLHLQKGVQYIVEQYGSVFPRDLPAVLLIPGIGKYTAGAILSIAFELPLPCVDGNTHRVFSRVFMQESILEEKAEKIFTREIAEAFLSITSLTKIAPSIVNQSVMELGALVCKPVNPLCNDCTLRTYCKALSKGMQGKRPFKKKKVVQKKKHIEAGIVASKDKIFMIKREKGSLLGELWGLPFIERKTTTLPGVALTDFLLQQYGFGIQSIKQLFCLTHSFTNQIWEIEVFQYSIDSDILIVRESNQSNGWFDEQQIKRLPIPNAFQKILDRYAARKLHVVAAIFRDQENRVFIAQRSPAGIFGNMWEFPGGK